MTDVPPAGGLPLAHGADLPGDHVGENTCPDCAGTGRRSAGSCDTCGGSGLVVEVAGDA